MKTDFKNDRGWQEQKKRLPVRLLKEYFKKKKARAIHLMTKVARVLAHNTKIRHFNQ